MHSASLWNALKGIALILLIPALALFALFLWRKRASIASGSGATASTTAAPSAAAGAQQSAAQQATDVIKAGTSLLNAFVGLIPSDSDYTADASEPAMQSAATATAVGNMATSGGLDRTAALA